MLYHTPLCICWPRVMMYCPTRGECMICARLFFSLKSKWTQMIPCVGLNCNSFYRISKEPQVQSKAASEPLQELINPSAPVAEPVHLFGLPPHESVDRPWTRLVTFAEKLSLPIVPSLTPLALSDARIKFCSILRIESEKYIDAKERMFDKFHLLCILEADCWTTSATRESWSAAQAQHVKGINVSKVSRMYNWDNELGLWEFSWPLDTQ